jgi:hypothetical protein
VWVVGSDLHLQLCVLVLCQRGIGVTLLMSCFLVRYPIWAQVPESDGGWGWNPALTGTVVSVGAIGNVIMQIFIFHRISKRFGLLIIYRFFWMFPISLLLTWPVFVCL